MGPIINFKGVWISLFMFFFFFFFFRRHTYLSYANRSGHYGQTPRFASSDLGLFPLFSTFRSPYRYSHCILSYFLFNICQFIIIISVSSTVNEYFYICLIC